MVERAPAIFKHRGRAVTAEDIVYFAKEASEKVAKVKVFSGLDEKGNSVPGLITVAIVPDIQELRPAPKGELIQIVEAYLKKIAPNIATLNIVGPVYYEVNVKAKLVITNCENVNKIKNEVKTKIEEFLHPLKGGKKGNGWDFGQVPSESDFYSLLSYLNGVSYVQKIDVAFTTESEASGKSSELLKSQSFSELYLPLNGKLALPSSGHDITVILELK